MYNIKLGADKILFGKDAIDGIKVLNGPRKKAFIVIGSKTMTKLGFVAQITDRLDNIGFQWMIFDEVEADPSFTTVMEGSKLMAKFQPDWIIGFGGGSAMDAAKVMWSLYENPEIETIEDLIKPGSIKKLREKAKICCIPTTSGTGSEITRAAVIKDTRKNIKHPVVDKDLRLIPDIAILDPGLTISMPKGLTAASGMDVITHAIESYVAINSNQFSRSLSSSSFILAYKNLKIAYEEPLNSSSRENMLAASAMAGISFSNSALGICHSIAHSFGGLYAIPHGLANAIVLPYILEFNSKDKDVKLKYAKLAKMIEEENLIKAIRNLNEALNIPRGIKEVVSNTHDFEKDVEELTLNALKDSSTNNTPLKPEFEELEKLIKACYYGN